MEKACAPLGGEDCLQGSKNNETDACIYYEGEDAHRKKEGSVCINALEKPRGQ